MNKLKENDEAISSASVNKFVRQHKEPYLRIPAMETLSIEGTLNIRENRATAFIDTFLDRLPDATVDPQLIYIKESLEKIRDTMASNE